VTLEKIVNEPLDVPGNKSFRDAIEALARELMRRQDSLPSASPRWGRQGFLFRAAIACDPLGGR